MTEAKRQKLQLQLQVKKLFDNGEIPTEACLMRKFKVTFDLAQELIKCVLEKAIAKTGK